MAGKSINSFGSKNWSPGPPATRYNASGKNREFYTFENAPGIGAYATGGTIIDGGDGYIYHIFTGAGTFQVNRPPAAIDSVDYLIVAGGAKTYVNLLPYIDEFYVTHVNGSYEGDTFMSSFEHLFTNQEIVKEFDGHKVIKYTK